jgi:hypothetical protein
MAAKSRSRMDLRREAEAAEAAGVPAKPAKKAAPKKPRVAKKDKIVRLKAFWGVFNQSLKRVALFEYSERKQADKKAVELTASLKSPHVVQPVKEVIQET